MARRDPETEDTRTADEKKQTEKATAEQEKRNREHLKRNVDPIFHDVLGLTEEPKPDDAENDEVPENQKGRAARS